VNDDTPAKDVPSRQMYVIRPRMRDSMCALNDMCEMYLRLYRVYGSISQQVRYIR